MATGKVCTDTVTVFNWLYAGADRRARYQATVLTGVHTLASEGQIASAAVAEDSLKLLLFDDRLTVPSGRAFLECRAFDRLSQAETGEYFTLRPDGRDYVALGAMETEDGLLPEDATLYRIAKVTRHGKGTRRMRHWTVEGS